MKILSGVSQSKDVIEALHQSTQSWPQEEIINIQIIIIFHSTSQDSELLAAEVKKRFPHVPSIGCSTAGEYLNGRHWNHSLVITAVASAEIKWAVGVLENLGELNLERTQNFAEKLTSSLNISLNQLDPSQHFCVCLMDGLSMKEETTAALLARSFRGIPVLGGSAGDDLKFKQTFVMVDGKSYSNAAAVLFGDSTVAFAIFKHQHFLRSAKDLVVTSVDPDARKVLSFDGMPAAHRYAEVLSLKLSDLNPSVFSQFPLTFSADNQIYVRSIQKVEDDGSLTFYCAVDEGMVLEIANHRPMEESLREDIGLLKNTLKSVEWFIGCNCILRSMETKQQGGQDAPQSLMSYQFAKFSIAFDTYGEQLNGLHMNQTLVGIAFGEKNDNKGEKP